MSSKTLLIVDDDQSTRAGLSEVLQNAGFDCMEAATYTDALRTLRTERPDVLITDIRLGAYNGLQLVIERPPEVAAIVITGFPDPVLAREAELYGATCMHKPIVPKDLVGLVRQTLYGYRDCDIAE